MSLHAMGAVWKGGSELPDLLIFFNIYIFIGVGGYKWEGEKEGGIEPQGDST